MNILERRKMSVYRCAVADIIDELQAWPGYPCREGFDFDGIDEDINEEIKDALEGIIESHFGEYLEYRILRRLSEREPAVITEAVDEIERLRAALQLIADDGNKSLATSGTKRSFGRTRRAKLWRQKMMC